MGSQCTAAVVLTRVQASFPHGVIPGQDYPALLAVLRRHLAVDSIARVATEFVVRGAHPLRGIDIPSALAALPTMVSEADVARIAGLLRLDAP